MLIKLSTSKFANKYRIKSNRLSGFDYGANREYFITICTNKKKEYFGKIVSDVETEYIPSLHATEMAIVAKQCWQQIPIHFNFVELIDFVVMPDHIHGVLRLNRPNKNDWTPNSFKSPSQNLGSIVRSYKGAVKRYATKNNFEFMWQKGYYDHVIHNLTELNRIIAYIRNNPQEWVKNQKR